MEGKVVLTEDVVPQLKEEKLIIGYLDDDFFGEPHLRMFIVTAEEMIHLLKFWIGEALKWDCNLMPGQYSRQWTMKRDFAHSRWALIAKLLPNEKLKKAEEEAFAVFKKERNFTDADWEVFLHGRAEDRVPFVHGDDQSSESTQLLSNNDPASEPREKPNLHNTSELLELLKYHYRITLKFRFRYFTTGWTGGSQMKAASHSEHAVSALSKILPDDAVNKAIDEVTNEFGKAKQPTIWEVFLHGTSEEREQLQEELWRQFEMGEESQARLKKESKD